jgi:hypothetical protein
VGAKGDFFEKVWGRDAVADRRSRDVRGWRWSKMWLVLCGYLGLVADGWREPEGREYLIPRNSRVGLEVSSTMITRPNGTDNQFGHIRCEGVSFCFFYPF